MTTLDTPLRKTGVGEKSARALEEQLDLRTVRDLLWHFPRRFQERGELTDIVGLSDGDEVTILAEVKSAHVRRMSSRPGHILEAVIWDGSGGRLSLTFFAAPTGKGKNLLDWHERRLRPGRRALFAGTVSFYTKGRESKRQLTHPAYELLEGDVDEASKIEEFTAPIPIYPATKDLNSWNIKKCVDVVLDTLVPPPEPLPSLVRSRHDLMPLGNALREMHRPTSDESRWAAMRRLKWDEAFAVQVSLVQRKRRAAQWPAVARPPRELGLLEEFDARLPYHLTRGQREVGEEIAADLAAAHPMHRLLQGEVGSGKTVCAVRGMLQVVDAGGQAALLAPTEVLAMQHYRSIRELLGPLGRGGELDGAEHGTAVALVTGSQGAAARRRALGHVSSGEAGIVIGTHALLYQSVQFADLGLVVVDEQHRFGVEQRDALRAKADQPPHVLVMTATPIPRTVAMTVFGDLDVSTLTELPLGRSPIASHVVPALEKPAYLERAWRRLREEIEQGHQAYIVCPRIGGEAAGEDVSTAEDAPDSAPDDAPARRPPIAVLDFVPVAQRLLEGLRVGVLHGRLPPDEKDAVMRDFAAGKLDALVATTVIEVGVDVANATVMVVLDADRFGVSQLHQLRGRVGRGSAPGLCLLVTESAQASPARARLEAVAATLDGFELAELDLEQRREGDVLGEAQSGRRSHLRLLSLLRDAAMIAEARELASELLDRDPDLTAHPALAAAVEALIGEERAEFLEKG